MKRTKNGGLVRNKTIIGGDNKVISEGSKTVNVNIGDRRDRRDSWSKLRSQRSEPSQKPGKINYIFFESLDGFNKILYHKLLSMS